MSSDRDYYDILGLKKDATTQEVRDAYREIARVYHPDSNFYDEIIEESMAPEVMDKFKEITSAYNTLVNADKRKLYDETLPPELKGWDDGKTTTHNEWVQEKARSSGVFAMGQFGNVKETPRSAAASGQGLTEEEEECLMSINEVEGYLKNRWKDRLRSALRFILPSRVTDRGRKR